MHIFLISHIYLLRHQQTQRICLFSIDCNMATGQPRHIGLPLNLALTFPTYLSYSLIFEPIFTLIFSHNAHMGLSSFI